jgi:hypothetical protein
MTAHVPRWAASARSVVLGLMILAGEFAVLEAALRLRGGSEASPAFQALFLQDPQVGYRLKPNAHARYTTEEFSTDLTINAQGVRDDRDIGPKAPDERRVVVLGDSLVLSVQVDLAETFCKQLETRLAATDSLHRWRVINAGVQGYGPVDEWLFYRHVVERFQPDIVLVVVFVGNAVAATDKEAWLDTAGPPTSAPATIAAGGIRRLVRASMVLQYARLRVNQLKARLNGPGPERPLASYLADPPADVLRGLDVSRRAIGLIAARATSQGAHTAIVLMPARFQTDDADYRRLAQIAAQTGDTLVRDAATDRFRQALAPIGVPMLDLLPVLQAQRDRSDLFFQQNIHLTPRGHRVVAEALFQFLETSGLATTAAR